MRGKFRVTTKKSEKKFGKKGTSIKKLENMAKANKLGEFGNEISFLAFPRSDDLQT